MVSVFKFCLFALLLASCETKQISVRHTSEKVKAPAAAAEAATPATSFQMTQADLRPLSKIEIQNSLQDIFLLTAPPELDGFAEQSSPSQIFRNSYDILNDSSSLAGLGRDIKALIAGLDLSYVSRTLVPCDAMDTLSCRSQLVKRIATHAWRRPLALAEMETLDQQSMEISKLALALQDEALRQMLEQIIFDPRFLFRLELGTDNFVTAPHYALAPWEKLTAISYNLKQRPPTFEQINSLEEFENDPRRFAQLIDDIVDSPDMAVSLASMISQWLMYYGLEDMHIQGDASWTRQKANDAMVSAQQFVAESLTQEGTLSSLFSRPNPENEGFGIFSSKAFLTATSKHGKGSMILRGVRIIRNALCQNMPVPPGSLNALPPADLSIDDPNYDIKLTLGHGARPDCSSCHRLIDPAGLALHAFNGFGANTNSIVDFSALGIPSQVTVSLGGQSESLTTVSAKDFAESIADSSIFARCFSRNALRYILGRDLTEGEIITADRLADVHLIARANDKDSLGNYFRDIMSSHTVYMRIRGPE